MNISNWFIFQIENEEGGHRFVIIDTNDEDTIERSLQEGEEIATGCQLNDLQVFNRRRIDLVLTRDFIRNIKQGFFDIP